MNTTYRCALGLAAALTVGGFVAPAAAQSRAFPQNTLRGTIVFGAYPEIRLNGRATSLVPGSRVRDAENRIVQAGTLGGARAVANYTLEIGGAQVRDVWILRPEEAAISPWPRTPEEAATWMYDATTMRWSKP